MAAQSQPGVHQHSQTLFWGAALQQPAPTVYLSSLHTGLDTSLFLKILPTHLSLWMAAQPTAASTFTVAGQGRQGRPRDHGQDLLEVQVIKQSSQDDAGPR